MGAKLDFLWAFPSVQWEPVLCAPSSRPQLSVHPAALCSGDFWRTGPPDLSPGGQEPLPCPVPGVLRAAGLWALRNQVLPRGQGSSGPGGAAVKSQILFL